MFTAIYEQQENGHFKLVAVLSDSITRTAVDLDALPATYRQMTSDTLNFPITWIP